MGADKGNQDDEKKDSKEDGNATTKSKRYFPLDLPFSFSLSFLPVTRMSY
jgi:hypothetical protein